MVKITKVYTRTGDKGETHLAGGLRVKKNSQRMIAIGAIDELNSLFGWALEPIRHEPTLHRLYEQGRRIQNELFNLGSQLAVLSEYRRVDTPVIREKDVTKLEEEIDAMNDDLPMLNSFILPGGGEISARLHVTRSQCRRAERELLTLAEMAQPGEPELQMYVNRLSDWLFVAARYVSKEMREPEALWVPVID